MQQIIDIIEDGWNRQSDGKPIRGDAELANAIANLENRIAAASGTKRRRRWGTVATKGL